MSFSAEEERVLKALAGSLLKAMGRGGEAGGAGANVEALDDHQLDNSWANKEIKKDPPKYSGPSMVGRNYSQATSEWHESNAGFMVWKSEKGKAENPPRLKNNGKPWWESDLFEAKICKAWALRNRGKSTAAVPADSGGSADWEAPAVNGGGDDLPF